MKGVYILLIELPTSAEVKTLRRSFVIDKGFYAYIGSAMNSLEARIERHRSSNKKRHWHIDFLLDLARIRAVISAQAVTRVECKIANQFADLPAVAGFGSSDCRCSSHLFYAPDFDILSAKAVTYFTTLGLEPITLLI